MKECICVILIFSVRNRYISGIEIVQECYWIRTSIWKLQLLFIPIHCCSNSKVIVSRMAMCTLFTFFTIISTIRSNSSTDDSNIDTTPSFPVYS